MVDEEDAAFDDEFFEKYAQLRQKSDCWTEENWESEMEKHPFFQKEFKPGVESPLTDALTQLKYDPGFNSPLELMDSYREDGNENFKMKKYNWAIASYAEGIKIARQEMVKKDNEITLDARIRVMKLVSTLYNNRASSQFYLENYRSSARDAKLAYGLDPDNQKAILRVARCYEALRKHSELIDYARSMSAKDIDRRPAKPTEATIKELTEMLDKADRARKLKQRDERKKQIAHMKTDQARKIVTDAVLQRGIKVKGSLFETEHAATFGHVVHFDESSQAPEGALQSLIWPVIFVYPDFVQTDFIQEFHELSTFSDHLEVLFAQPPEWDTEHVMIPNKLRVFIRHDASKSVREVDAGSTLLDALRNPAIVVTQGVPMFMVALEEPRLEFH